MWLIDQERFMSYENDSAKREVGTERRAARRSARLALTRGKSDQRLTDQLH